MREMLEIPAIQVGSDHFDILVHGGEVAPLRITAGDFGDAGFEVNANHSREEKDGGADGGLCGASGDEIRVGQEKRDEAASRSMLSDW